VKAFLLSRRVFAACLCGGSDVNGDGIVILSGSRPQEEAPQREVFDGNGGDFIYSFFRLMAQNFHWRRSSSRCRFNKDGKAALFTGAGPEADPM